MRVRVVRVRVRVVRVRVWVVRVGLRVVRVGVRVVRVGVIVVPPQRGIPARPRRRDRVSRDLSRPPVVIPRRVGVGGPGAHPESVKINLSK